MIEITKEKIGDEEFNVFTVLSDGFVPSGHVEMTCRVFRHEMRRQCVLYRRIRPRRF